ncbi:MAG: response regulator transcription factor [Suipraeoptans sp.]
MFKILFVDDDQSYAQKLEKALKQKEFHVVYMNTPVAAIAEVVKAKYDLVLSDYSMPQIDGSEFISIIKDIKPEIKTIILTGHSEEDIEFAAIDAEVDFFISKDKSLKLIIKYIEAVLEKPSLEVSSSKEKLVSKAENIVIYKISHDVYKNGERADITNKEYDLLVMFLENKGVAFSREKLAEDLWTVDIEKIDLRVIDGHIKRLRNKLRLFSIISVRGYGYKWNE